MYTGNETGILAHARVTPPFREEFRQKTRNPSRRTSMLP